jgi:hypothetical protein
VASSVALSTLILLFAEKKDTIGGKSGRTASHHILPEDLKPVRQRLSAFGEELP